MAKRHEEDQKECPSPQVIREYVLGRFIPAKEQELAHHVIRCPNCQLVANAVDSSDERNYMLMLMALVRMYRDDDSFCKCQRAFPPGRYTRTSDAKMIAANLRSTMKDHLDSGATNLAVRCEGVVASVSFLTKLFRKITIRGHGGKHATLYLAFRDASSELRANIIAALEKTQQAAHIEEPNFDTTLVGNDLCKYVLSLMHPLQVLTDFFITNEWMIAYIITSGVASSRDGARELMKYIDAGNLIPPPNVSLSINLH